MNLTKLVMKRPVSALMALLIIVVFGISAIGSMPQELMPEMELPVMVVYTIYPGAGPQDVEKLVSKEVEGVVGSLNGIKNITSQSQENMSLVILQYEYGTNMDIAYTDLKEKLDTIKNQLPDKAQTPIAMEIDVNAQAAVTLSVSSQEGSNLLYTVEEEIVPEFEKLGSVSDVSIAGGQEEYIRVELMEEKMQQYGVSMNTIIGSLSNADFSIPGGTTDHGNRSLNVRSSVEYRTTEALRNIPVPLGSGNNIRLSDVANIYDATKDAGSISRFNGEKDINVSIFKRQSSSAATVSKEVHKIISQLEAKYPELIISIASDASDTITESLTSVASTLVLGILLSMLVLYLFLGDIKASLIVGSSMPVSLLITFMLMNWLGFTMNVVSMSGLVLGVGMMVDNSIVVIDSCFKAKTREKTFAQSALEGTKSVMSSIVGSTITTVVVFVPIAIIQGMSGQMFKPLGFTIVFSLSASLLCAITLVPLFFAKFKPEEKRNAPAALLLKKVERAYSRLVRKILNKKKTVVAVSLALLALSVFLATQLNLDLMGSSDEGIIAIDVKSMPGLKLEQVDSLLTGLEGMVAEHPDVDHYTLSATSSGSSLMSSGSSAAITAYLKDKSDMSTKEVIEEWRKQTRSLTDCEVTVSSSSSSGMSTSSDDYAINLKGNDLDILKAASDQVADTMRQHPDILQVTSTFETPAPQMEIIVDPVKAAAFSYTPIGVATEINMSLSGVETVSIKKDGQEYAIWVEYPKGKYEISGDIQNMILVSPTGYAVPLSEIALLKFTDSPQTITRENNQYVVTVTGTPTNAAKYSAKKELDPIIQALDFPQGVSLSPSSLTEMMSDELGAMGGAIAVAVFLVFIVMAMQFESVKHSLMVMICIPFSLIGCFVLLFITNTTISMVTMLGFLVLVGTVVNNGILFVDTVNNYRSSMDLNTALVYTGRTRLRPILMTTLTTVLSMLPMAMNIGDGAEMMQGLALVVIGGLTASTILTLILLPTFYLIIDGNPKKKKKKEEKQRLNQEKKQIPAGIV